MDFFYHEIPKPRSGGKISNAAIEVHKEFCKLSIINFNDWRNYICIRFHFQHIIHYDNIFINSNLEQCFDLLSFK